MSFFIKILLVSMILFSSCNYKGSSEEKINKIERENSKSVTDEQNQNKEKYTPKKKKEKEVEQKIVSQNSSEYEQEVIREIRKQFQKTGANLNQYRLVVSKIDSRKYTAWYDNSVVRKILVEHDSLTEEYYFTESRLIFLYDYLKKGIRDTENRYYFSYPENSKSLKSKKKLIRWIKGSEIKNSILNKQLRDAQNRLNFRVNSVEALVSKRNIFLENAKVSLIVEEADEYVGYVEALKNEWKIEKTQNEFAEEASSNEKWFDSLNKIIKTYQSNAVAHSGYSLSEYFKEGEKIISVQKDGSWSFYDTSISSNKTVDYLTEKRVYFSNKGEKKVKLVLTKSWNTIEGKPDFYNWKIEEVK